LSSCSDGSVGPADLADRLPFVGKPVELEGDLRKRDVRRPDLRQQGGGGLRALSQLPEQLRQTAIARIEAGERKPTLPTILKLARGLEVPPAKLFEGIDG
jgi:transcriptional regulator with XRE-family HTH domain